MLFGRFFGWVVIGAIIMVTAGLMICGWLSATFFPAGLTAGALKLSMRQLSWVFLVTYIVFLSWFTSWVSGIIQAKAKNTPDFHPSASESFLKLKKGH